LAREQAHIRSLGSWGSGKLDRVKEGGAGQREVKGAFWLALEASQRLSRAKSSEAEASQALTFKRAPERAPVGKQPACLGSPLKPPAEACQQAKACHGQATGPQMGKKGVAAGV
jgi:hypothetical protein